MKEKSKLEKLKEEYKIIQEEHSLPSFEDLNREFSIERVIEVETDFLVREVRRQISEKFSGTLRLIDVLLNPSNTPAFLFPAIKSISKEEKEIMEKIYESISKMEMENIKLDLIYSESEDIKYIKNAFCYWIEIKKDLSGIFSCIENNWGKKSEKANNCYFG